MSERLLDIHNLEVIYKTDLETVHAVNGIDLHLNKGQTLGLVGETGAGKTTTALSILCLLPERTARVKGEIIFDGQDLLKMKEHELRNVRGEKISMIFQDPMTSLNPILTVGNQIGEALLLHNDQNRTHEQIEKRVEEVLEMVGIPAFRKKDYPHQFSGGMKQRVVIAMALACNPRLLIADEPTTALDVTIQAQVLDLIRELKTASGTSMLLITHDLGVVAETCDAVAVIYAGEIVEFGTLEDIFDHASHPYTKCLFATIPSLDKDVERLQPITGPAVNAADLPEGCSFCERCPQAQERCRSFDPPAVEVSPGHLVKCVLAAEGPAD